MRTTIFIASIVLGAVAIAYAAGDWRSTERTVEEFKKEHEQLRKLTPEETRKIVMAICDAEEADRQAVARDASKRAKDAIGSKYSGLEKRKNEVIKMLGEVAGDDKKKADSAKKDVLQRWDSIERMSKSLRGANHPVVAYMLEKGQDAHKARQKDCDVAEFPIGSGKADCIKASSCEVIEIKPNNSTAIARGNQQVQVYLNELNKKGKAFEALVAKDKNFAKCVKFKPRVDCYTLCPVIDENGELRSASPEWKKDC